MGNAFFIAWKEASHFRLSSIGQVAIVAVLLLPLLLMLAVENGIVTDLRTHLESNPESLRLRPVRSQSLDEDWFETMAADPRVGFIAPHPYENASQINVRASNDRVVNAAILASGEGDPFLPESVSAPSDSETVLTAIMAANLDVEIGDTVTVLIECHNLIAPVEYPLEITGIVERSRWSTIGALVSREFVTQQYLCRNHASELFATSGPPPPETVAFPQFRLFAARLEDVRPLTEALATRDVHVTGQFASADLADSIERTARTIMATLIFVVSLGAGLAFSAALHADARRMRPDLATLRIDGLTRAEALITLVLKGLLVTLAGCAIGVAGFYAATALLNGWIAAAPLPFETTARLAGSTLGGVVLVIILIAGLAAVWAAVRTFTTSPLEDQNAI